MQRRSWLAVISTFVLAVAVTVILTQTNKISAQGGSQTAGRYQLITAPYKGVEAGKLADKTGLFMVDTATGTMWIYEEKLIQGNTYRTWAKADIPK